MLPWCDLKEMNIDPPKFDVCLGLYHYDADRAITECAQSLKKQSCSRRLLWYRWWRDPNNRRFVGPVASARCARAGSEEVLPRHRGEGASTCGSPTPAAVTCFA